MTLGLHPDELALQARAREFATSIVRPRAAAIDRDEQYPWDIVRALAEAKFLGMTIPTQYGGQGRSFLDGGRVRGEVAKACGARGRTIVETTRGAIAPVRGSGREAKSPLAADLVLAGD